MICFPLDDTEYEAKEMGAYLATRTRGVFSAEDNLRVSPGQSGLTVTVAPGLAWLKRSDWWGVAALQDTALTFTLDKADGALSRMDAIVARLDKVGNRAEIAVKKGSFSSSPTVADPVRDDSADEIYLATVLVEPGAVSLTAAAVTDQRLNESYCGLMRDGVTGIPTAMLQQQAQELIDELRRVIAGIETGSEVMLRTVYDKDGDGVVDKARNANVAQDSELLATHSPEWYAPPGMIVPYGGAAAPAGWLLCDGRAVSRTAYADLYAVIGTTYGAGNGSTTFTLPDLRGRVAAGANASNALASRAGADSKHIARANLPAEKLRIADNGSWIVDTTQFGVHSGKPLSLGNNRSEAEYLYTEPMGSGTAFDVRQATLYLNYIIKY